jgi:hypothetical protein
MWEGDLHAGFCWRNRHIQGRGIILKWSLEDKDEMV